MDDHGLESKVSEWAKSGYTVGAIQSMLGRIRSCEPPFPLLVTEHGRELLIHALNRYRISVRSGNCPSAFLMGNRDTWSIVERARDTYGRDALRDAVDGEDDA